MLGDARLTLASAPDRAYGVIVLDAYSADASVRRASPSTTSAAGGQSRR